MSLRAAGNRATNDAEAGRQGLGRTIFSRMHDASVMSWPPNRACPLAFMQRDATKCNKMQHFWHFRGCCTVRHPTLEAGDAEPRMSCSTPVKHAPPGMHHLSHRRPSHSLPPLGQHHWLWVLHNRHTSHAPKCTKMHHFFDFFQLPSNAASSRRTLVASFAIYAFRACLSLSNARAQRFQRSH